MAAAKRKCLVLEFKWNGPARATGDPIPTHLVGLSPSDTVDMLEAQLRLLFDVRKPAELLLFENVEHNGSNRLVAGHPGGILHGVGLYYATEEDPDFLPLSSVVYVQSTQPAAAPIAAGSTPAESGCTKPAKAAHATKTISSDKQRDHQEWVQLSDRLWPLLVPRYHSCMLHTRCM